MGTWGWKTVLASLLWALSNVLQESPMAIYVTIGGILEFIYPLLFGVGIAHKFVKLNGGK